MSGEASFAHLHVHTEYSMLDGAARVQDLVDGCVEAGMPAIAMTDHGNVFGAYDFWSRCTRAGITPVIGMEAYVAPGSRHERRRAAVGGGALVDGQTGENYTHMTLLATTTPGMHNLFRLASLASLEGYYYKPRVDRELLASHADGLVATTGCPSGEVNRLLQQGRPDAARAAAGDFLDIFGEGNYFVELMDHDNEIERRTARQLLELAGDLDLPLLATNDLHYTRAEDAAAHEILLCVQTGRTVADPGRFKFDGSGYHLKSPAEMRHLWRELPEACDNTLRVAERVDVTFDVGRDLMPRFPVPEGFADEGDYLAAEVRRGLERRFAGRGVPEQHARQADYEVGVIRQMGFPGYFLVTADLVRHAKESGIRVGPGRGSAAGCLVAWAMGITELDPIEHGLLFERFLNPERVSMPDIDMDFDERRRGDMIRYATEKYGEERVAQIVTYGTIKAKQAVKDSARVLGHPFGLGEKITKAFPPPVMGREIDLAAVDDPANPRYKEAAELRQLVETDPDVADVVGRARGLENLKRQWGVHAAGVILSREPLLDVVPIMKREADGAIITQLDMGACEDLGLLKMDFLGLRNLTVIEDCLAHLRAAGVDLVLEDLPLADGPTYELLARGDTLGVFQLDGGPMQSLLRLMRPTDFSDISAVLALYRPGPMGVNAHIAYADRKNGREPVVPLHPELAEALDEVLGETYGLIVYQEQVMAIAQQLAGYTLGQADLLRRAMGKKKREVLEAERERFASGMAERGFSPAAVTALWDTLLPFSDYAFNKAHTAGYGLVSFWTAYLKANHPAEYMAALLTSVKDDKDKSALYLHECRRLGITVLPPDVNVSDADYTPVDGSIRFGLTAVRNVGANVVDSLTRTRRDVGEFADLGHLLKVVEPVVCNKRVLESLAKAGAFDSLGHSRRGVVAVHAEAVDAAMTTKKAEAVGQFDLFGGEDAGGADTGLSAALVVPDEEWDKTQLLAFERDMLGLYVSDHPLLGVEHVLARQCDLTAGQVARAEDLRDGARVVVGGLLTAVERRMTRKGDQMATATLEDLSGSVELMVFPQAFLACGHECAEDAVVVVTGRVQARDDGRRLVVDDVRPVDLSSPSAGGPLVLAMPPRSVTPDVVGRLKQVLAEHPGETEVHLALVGEAKKTVIRLDTAVNPTQGLMGDLKALLGTSCLEPDARLVRAA